MRRLAVISVLGALAVAGCDTSQGGLGGMGPKQTGGSVVGAVGGGLLGSQIGDGTGQLIATGLGTLLGGFIGSEVGRSLDKADRAAAGNAFNQASTAPVGETISWRNPDSGNYGTVTPTRDGRAQDGRLCREYKTTVYVEGRYEEATGIACRNADGTWQMVS